jgi:serine/threonine protein kinase
MDVFSYGVLLCEVLTCQFPNQQAVFKTMLEQVRSQHHPYLYDVIQSCIKRNPQDRPDMNQIIQQLDTRKL